MAGTKIGIHVVAIVVLVINCNTRKCSAREKQRVPCFFIFGDSTLDSGNNNKLNTAGKVNYKPYGIDFPQGPTGRFSNGRTVADLFGQYMGFQNFIKPFSTANGSEILQGVNYASGYSGILDETGKHVGDRVVITKQLQHFQVTISRIAHELKSNKSAKEYIRKCLYLVGTGGNDYLNNYFLPSVYNTSRQYTPEQYSEVLKTQYTRIIKFLQKQGARKIAISGVLPIGCTPNATASFNTHGSICVNKINDAVQLFNKRLKSMVDHHNRNQTSSKFAYLDAFDVFLDHTTYLAGLEGPSLFKGCCQTNDYGLCVPLKAPCPQRTLKIFWDAIHPTEAINQIVTTACYNDLQKIL